MKLSAPSSAADEQSVQYEPATMQQGDEGRLGDAMNIKDLYSPAH
jgi:hypothetical protein